MADVSNDTLLIKNGLIVTMGENNRVLEGSAVLCERGTIKNHPAAIVRDRNRPILRGLLIQLKRKDLV